MTDKEFKDAVAAILKQWAESSKTPDPATWDNGNQHAWDQVFDKLEAAGGDPQARPQRRPGS